MKLLFDENLSPRLVRELADRWPDSTHVEDHKLRGAADGVLWEFARVNGYTLVSKDEDFCGLSLVRGSPPKVVWLQVGNTSTARIAALLRAQTSTLLAFGADPIESILILRG